jgi:aspartate racemase
MHMLADHIERAVHVPLLHIVDAVGDALRPAGVKRPLLLATRFTMEEDFYVSRLRERHRIEPIIPDAQDRQVVHDVIFNELCQGRVEEVSRRRYLDIIQKEKSCGADAVILGCTEIGLLIDASDIDLPTFDSTLLHADAAVEFALPCAVPRRVA